MHQRLASDQLPEQTALTFPGYVFCPTSRRCHSSRQARTTPSPCPRSRRRVCSPTPSSAPSRDATPERKSTGTTQTSTSSGEAGEGFTGGNSPVFATQKPDSLLWLVRVHRKYAGELSRQGRVPGCATSPFSHVLHISVGIAMQLPKWTGGFH